MLSELFDEDQQCMYDIPEDFKPTGSSKFFEETPFTNEKAVQTNILDNDDISDEYNCSVFFYKCDAENGK